MAKPRRRPAFSEVTRQLKTAATPPRPYSVEFTETARKTFFELHEASAHAERRGDPTNQHCTTFRMVDDAIRRVIPAGPTNRKYALHQPLDGFYRIAKGRLRLVWFVDVERRVVLIMFISDTPRKAGDAKDPYVILTAMAKRGYLHKIVEDWRKALEVPSDAPID